MSLEPIFLIPEVPKMNIKYLNPYQKKELLRKKVHVFKGFIETTIGHRIKTRCGKLLLILDKYSLVKGYSDFDRICKLCFSDGDFIKGNSKLGDFGF